MTLKKGEISHITEKQIWNENTATVAYPGIFSGRWGYTRNFFLGGGFNKFS
jgi:hypothetical protein